jgi:hypothetical protein
MNEYKVPRLLWESLESVMMAQGRIFVKDIAKRLKVNEKELLRKVFPSSESIKVYIHDTHTDTLQCSAHIQDDTVIQHCRRPVQCGSEYCYEHQTKRMMLSNIGYMEVHKLQDAPERPSLWVRNRTEVVDSTGKVIGRWNPDTNKLTIFVFDT